MTTTLSAVLAPTSAREPSGPSDTELLDRYRSIFARIATGAVDRERERRLATTELEGLRELGFGALRVPVDLGGSGVSLRQLFLLQIELAAAESNLVQALRVHFRFTEDRWRERDTERGREWLRRIGEGAIVGNASSERSGNLRGATGATLRRSGDRLVLNGTKYYSTGSLFSDWISVAVAEGGRRLTALVPRDAPGVELVDDYGGFGQRTSASGTTVLTDVQIDPGNVIESIPGVAQQNAVLQVTHLATLAGVLRRAVDDTADFVRRRTRSYNQGLADRPREDPLVQHVLGRADAAAHAVRHIVLGVATVLDEVNDRRFALRVTVPDRRPSGAEQALADDEVAAELEVLRAQSVVIDIVLRAVTSVFEVGGASLVEGSLAIDRHWRNARTLAQHNPVIYRERQIGDHLLNGATPKIVPGVGESPGVAPASGIDAG